MKIHEYQAKAILKKYGVAVPRGAMATTREEAEAVGKDLFDSGASGVVVKAQIHAGVRGKGGGVKIAKSLAEASDWAGPCREMEPIDAPNVDPIAAEEAVRIGSRFLEELKHGRNS